MTSTVLLWFNLYIGLPHVVWSTDKGMGRKRFTWFHPQQEIVQQRIKEGIGEKPKLLMYRTWRVSSKQQQNGGKPANLWITKRCLPVPAEKTAKAQVSQFHGRSGQVQSQKDVGWLDVWAYWIKKIISYTCTNAPGHTNTAISALTSLIQLPFEAIPTAISIFAASTKPYCASAINLIFTLHRTYHGELFVWNECAQGLMRFEWRTSIWLALS